MHKHEFIPSVSPLYDYCITCGTWKLRESYPREKYLDNYWDGQQHSTLDAQKFNVEIINRSGETKCSSMLNYCIGRNILEIGCAPGSFLKMARKAGFTCTGIEPSPEYRDKIQEYSECPVFLGFFEDYPVASKFDTIVAMDVFEHILNGEAFLHKCLELLEVGGRIVFMLPLVDECREQDRHPEHEWLYSKKFLKEWMEDLGLKIEFGRWTQGHSIIVIEK